MTGRRRRLGPDPASEQSESTRSAPSASLWLTPSEPETLPHEEPGAPEAAELPHPAAPPPSEPFPAPGSRRQVGATWGLRRRRSPGPARTLVVDEPAGRGGRTSPAVVVGAAAAFNLVLLHPELVSVQSPNDGAVHQAMIRWAEQRLNAGHGPFDGWFPNLSLGSGLFHTLPSLPHVVVGDLAVIFGADRSFHWSLYLLLALWPVSVYWGARLFNWARWPAAAAALVSPLVMSLPGYGFEPSSYTFRGLGSWAQLWGMWLLPLALGLGWRAVAQPGRRRSVALAGLAIGLTIACHLASGFVALAALVVWVVIRPSDVRRRLVRAVVVAVGAAITASFVLIPLIADQGFAARTEFSRGTVFTNSYGARRVLTWLVEGRLFDHGRAPVLTLLVGVGVAVCIASCRRDERARALLGFEVLGLILYSGGPALSRRLYQIPGTTGITLNSFIIAVHMGGIILAGIGLVTLGRKVLALAGSRAAPRALLQVVVVALVLVVLAPAWYQVARYDRHDGTLIARQAKLERTDGADLNRLITKIRSLGGGRVYAGSLANWGRQYTVGYVPVSSVLLGHDVDAIGFQLRTLSLSSDPEARFDAGNAFNYQLFGVRYLLLPDTMTTPVPATLVDHEGRHTLWRVDGDPGYLQVIDTSGSVTADRSTIGRAVAGFMASHGGLAVAWPTVAFGGLPAAGSSLGTSAVIPPGAVVADTSDPGGGVYSAQVTTTRAAVIVAKATFGPRWRVTVDGQEVAGEMIAPSVIGREVSAGDHTVVFRYLPFRGYLAILLASALALVLMELVHQVVARRWRRSSRTDWTVH